MDHGRRCGRHSTAVCLWVMDVVKVDTQLQSVYGIMDVVVVDTQLQSVYGIMDVVVVDTQLQSVYGIMDVDAVDCCSSVAGAGTSAADGDGSSRQVVVPLGL
eukprot:TRINITY_DN33766_c0_g1_i5.p1 TRINITY_DN33766_c0_g1~~TRINITY_DN33766_c0_g1_i5.p1  ORF type:complete len:102 (+),score=15.79 TRINITY_DN33766_c0_g1_i5:46-351(+)